MLYKEYNEKIPEEYNSAGIITDGLEDGDLLVRNDGFTLDKIVGRLLLEGEGIKDADDKYDGLRLVKTLGQRVDFALGDKTGFNEG